jgi:hypothetical protein
MENKLEKLIQEFVSELKDENIYLANELKNEKVNSSLANKKLGEIYRINLIVKRLIDILEESKPSD